jgi:O-antigen/teichoic acid export membrane protein
LQSRARSRSITKQKPGMRESPQVLKTPAPSEEILERLTKRIAKGGGITLVGSGFGKVVQFGLHILLGRVLGASGYGLYALGFSVLRLASQISILGLQNGIVRFVSIYKGEGDLGRIKGTLISAFTIATLASILVGTFLFLFSSFISIRIFTDPQLISVLRVFAIALPFFVMMQMTAHTARGFQRVEYYVGIQNFIWPIANTLFVVMAFLVGYRLMGAVYGFLGSMMLTAAHGLLSIPKKIFPRDTSFQPNYDVKKLLRFSLPVVFIGFGHLLLTQTDRLMIGYFMSSVDVGRYSAAAMIAVQTSFVITAFNIIFAPMIADLYNQRKIRELDGLFKIVTRWIVVLTLPLILVMVLSPKLVMELFGREFLPGAAVLFILAIAHFVNAATGSVGLIYIMSGKQDIEFVNILSMAALNIALNVWLIPVFGVIGAAIATGLSIVIVNIVRVIGIYKLIGIQPYTRKYFKPLLGSGLVILLLLFLTNWSGINIHWALSLALCPLLYVGFVVILGLENEDKVVLTAIRRKLTSIL